MSSAFTRLHPQRPIFGTLTARGGVVYVPGHVATVRTGDWDDFRRVLPQSPLPTTTPGGLTALAHKLVQLAQSAQDRYAQLATADFEPECLTLYLSNHCNLGCSYCYAAEPDGARLGGAVRGEREPAPLLEVLSPAPRLPVLSVDDLRAAADRVADHCAQRGRTFHLVVHGGGEPTLHPALLKQAVELTQGAARRQGVDWFGYLATHGIIPPDLVDWLSASFNRIGVSCDGPPDIHDRQRPSRNGGEPTGTFPAVARTIQRLRGAGTALTLRATITPGIVQRQAEIVTFFAQEFGPVDIAFEPAYAPHGRPGDGFQPDDAPRFATHFLAAQRIADGVGCRLELSGVRLDEIHGPFCNVLRNVLHLTPDGTATACFLSTDGRSPRDEPFRIGERGATGEFVMDTARMRGIQARALELPARCHDCVNIHHCARDCPEVCPVVEPDRERFEAAGFRCRVQQQVAETWILDIADRQWNRSPEHTPEIDPGEAIELSRLLTMVPASVDADEITRQWQKLPTRGSGVSRRLPQPPWALRAYDDVGAAVWERLRESSAATDPGAPLAAYVHLPFCDRKCAFCDCYAIYLPPGEQQQEQSLTDALLREIDAWASLPDLAQRPLSTVHFGGGTANYLDAHQFGRIVEALRRRFHAVPETEWAIESTSSQLGTEPADRLWDLGFRRLHVGVQTLDDGLRRLIGRRESGRTVQDKLAALLSRGFIVSVDLLYGLPGLTLEQFASDIESLARLGVDGCSLYQLNASPRNARFIAEHRLADRSAVADFVMFHVGEQMLNHLGYRKTHFAHFSRPRDRHLYYTHVARGEDLLALGPTADGIVGDYNFRHPHLGPYLLETSGDRPALEGGLADTPAQSRLRPLSAALMANTLTPGLLAAVSGAALLDDWLDQELIRLDPDRHEACQLTPSGSWSISRMLDQLAEHCGATG
jgi:anaerobilin synthase